MKPPLPQHDIRHVLNVTHDIWPEFSEARIFLTGGTGFVGKWLIETFLAANDAFNLNASLIVLSRDPQAFLAEMPHLAASSVLTYCKGDVRNFEAPAGTFSHVIHAATDVATAAAPLDTFDVTLAGTQRVLDLCKNAQVRRLLLLSSGAIYGRQLPEVTHVDERYSGAPSTTAISSAYGEGKRASEWLACAHASTHQYCVSIARCFAFVGPHLPLDKHFAIGNFIRDAMAGSEIHIGGDGTPIRSYLYAADLTIWLWTMLARAPGGQAFNVGSDEGFSIGELAQQVMAAAGKQLPVHIVKTPRPGTPAERYLPNISKAGADLGLAVHVPLVEAIKRTMDWYQQKGDAQ